MTDFRLLTRAELESPSFETAKLALSKISTKHYDIYIFQEKRLTKKKNRINQ